MLVNAAGIGSSEAIAGHDERTWLTLVWAVLDIYITHAKNGVRFNQLERQRLRRMRQTGSEQPDDEEVTAA